MFLNTSTIFLLSIKRDSKIYAGIFLIFVSNNVIKLNEIKISFIFVLLF